MNVYPENLAQAMNNTCDGSHWGITDWYEDIENALLAVLESGEDFDTGWYASKKEIWSGRVSLSGATFTLQASCSDDFDTEGRGSFKLEVDPSEPPEAMLERIRGGLDQALEEAETNRRDNQVYAGWSVGQLNDDGTRLNWLYTYIQPLGEGHHYDEPPGGNYFHWGWDDQDPEEEGIAEEWAEGNGQKYPDLPDDIREAFEEFILSYGGESMELNGWYCRSWAEATQ